MDRRLPGSLRKWCITARMRSMLTFASLALPFQVRQRRRSTSSTITAFAAALRTIGRQASGNLRQVLQPHGDMEPVEYRKPRDASVEKNAPQPGTAVGKRRQHCALGPPDRIEATADQACEIRVGLRHGAEDLPPSARRLDIADPNLQPPLAGLATPNEG